jgi:hypothetical protein
MYLKHLALIETGVLEPLDDYVTEDFDVEDFENHFLTLLNKMVQHMDSQKTIQH